MTIRAPTDMMKKKIIRERNMYKELHTPNNSKSWGEMGQMKMKKVHGQTMQIEWPGR
jgi:hypothetical protein